MTDLPVYEFTREFKAPLDRVWHVWTTPELLARWYGPGVETVIHRFDLEPGGEWRNEMKWGENSDLSKMTFQEILPQEKLVWLHCSADKDWNVAANARMPDWPKTLLTTVSFTAKGDTTEVTLTQVPVDASEAEIKCFAEMMRGMDNGWGSGYKIIDEILAEA